MPAVASNAMPDNLPSSVVPTPGNPGVILPPNEKFDDSGPGRPISPSGAIPELVPDDRRCCIGSLVVLSENENGLHWVRVSGKDLEICSSSLYIFSLTSPSGCFRRRVIEIVTCWMFDKFVLFLILANSICLASYDQRAETDDGFNWVSDNIIDPILTSFFTLEFILKVIAFGFFIDKTSYLRDKWNWLDFVVVITGNLQLANVVSTSEGVGFLRMFRILRPLRSLNAVPQMKVLVNTVISSIPRLGNVSIMGAFLFGCFGILGLSLLDGVFYHSCREFPNPILQGHNGTECWYWPPTGEERLCGGAYMCQEPPEGISRGYCGGHEQDPNDALRPSFEGGRRGFPWCEGSEPKKVFPESEWIHFDHMLAALITIFQCMTLEGWTVVMYQVQDGYGFFIGTVYFFLLIPITSFFLLNVALAVVDEAREDFAAEEAEEEETKKAAEDKKQEMDALRQAIAKEDGEEPPPSEPLQTQSTPASGSIMGKAGDWGIDLTAAMENAVNGEEDEDEEQAPWLDILPVRFLKKLATNEVFTNIIMFFIAGNVVTMMLDQYTPQVAWQDFLAACEAVFLGIFLVEMVIMIGAYGPCRYLKTPVMCFDGVIVLVSVAQALAGESGPFTALRTLRLFRVLNKLASRWPSFRVLLKAMLYTGKSLSYWIVLFSLLLYIYTLMWMQLFARKFHFEDPDTLAVASDDIGQPWCAGTENRTWHFRQDCIPRAHFDTFLWSLVSIFQIMTGENWNTIMYAGMRSQGWPFAFFFVGLIVFGQILFLSLFLSMLLSKFDEVQDSMERQEMEKRKREEERHGGPKQKGLKTWVKAVHGLRMKSTISQVLKSHHEKVAPLEEEEEEEEKKDKSPAPKASAERKPWQADAEEVDGEGEGDQADEEQKPERSPQSSENDAEDDCGGGKKAKTGEDAPESPEVPPPQLPIETPPAPPPRPYPHGYAWFVFSPTNPVRRLCHWILKAEVEIFKDKIKVFDNIILFCILISSVGMACDSPLAHPDNLLTQVIRTSDRVFAIIFAAEMLIKLIAFGLCFIENGYLKDGWNILDGAVVIVSLVDMAGTGGGGFLKTLRILRAFRPLRIISRNQNLKVVVQTIFSSLLDLFTLTVVALLFLLIFGLFALSYLSGRMYSCQSDASIALLRDLGDDFTTPLCLSFVENASCPLGHLQENPGGSSAWVGLEDACPTSSCGESFTNAWLRASADTPICVGRCNPNLMPGDPTTAPEWICPKPLTKTSELPSVCPGSNTPEYLLAMSEDEQRGREYIEALQRNLVIPCFGSTADSTDGLALSCRKVFCPEGVSEEKAKNCRLDCEQHPFFCKNTCAVNGESSAECQSCRQECAAACECSEHCEPLIKDAALCVEQGGRWAQTLSQNFDNVWSAMLTLFEISSTEGWADVMYAACDSVAEYTQPIRDYQQWVFAPFFVAYMTFSNMFIINLSVGVIVDKFMDLKQSGKSDIMLTPAQVNWIASQKHLLKRRLFFDMTDLDKLPSPRRMAYRLISSGCFTGGIMAAIAANSALMAMKVFPSPLDWWDEFLDVGKMVFFVIFFLEFVLKFYALRSAYWADRWNQFDFFCICVSLFGYIIKFAAGVHISVLSLFRVVRLFRLLKFMKGVKKIFAALAASIPKLVNVMAILLLLLILYSILGVSLFSTLKFGDTLDHHGNFQNFVLAFITLFRASTGEAWNEIMHDLAKPPEKIFRSGDWCTPDYLFDTADHYKDLEEKCLIQQPNSCVSSTGPTLAVLYWTSYTLVVSIMVMNLVIAVILESYEDGKGAREGEILDYCIEAWKKLDPDHKLFVTQETSLTFLADVLNFALAEDEKDIDFRAFIVNGPTRPNSHEKLKAIPMRFAATLDIDTSAYDQVHFFAALRQVLKLICAKSSPTLMLELKDLEEHMDAATREKLKMKERTSTMKSLQAMGDRGGSMKEFIAALKIQTWIREYREGGHRSSRASAMITIPR
eukprot:TRINITY_DN17609_c4_g1_i1.p1 TRINITY_DN17609_c4_g1~~TRINITY_DN17609_c4_g1_i1.p1  ORF type:complete len:1956 (-),score=450.68 TRINITY_DN17609_c4_g1_i1:314-6181(-)